MPVTEAVDLELAAARLVAAVREAGALALSMFGAPINNWTKFESSPVSDADIAVDRLLRERLTDADSGIRWLSEESIDDPARLSARYVWIVDPIDGTRAYLAGSPDWTVSAALVEDGRPVAGCLYAPVTDEFFFAIAGRGASCNGAPIATTDGSTLEHARIAGPRAVLERLVAIQ
ncbi:MAG: inositol monophosphatase family protein, partial [Xanthobacteraceae bacterium]